VSLRHFSTVGSLMGKLIAIHGWLKGLTLILVGHVNHIIRPRLKLH
jgi:hypothetical protein